MAFDKRLISSAVAYDLTPSAIATWHEALARTPRVLVPIVVDALIVREEGGTWADCAMSAPAAGAKVAAHELLAAPFAERDPRKPGAYLHWALPDALTRGAASATSPDVPFPPIPDRWLVVRLSASRSLSRRAVSAWVIEAGEEKPTVTPLDAWAETADPDRTDTPGEQPLTALGHGDAVWAGYFDNVENRLAFHDDLEGVSGPLAYLVCGWHSRHVDDPIGEGLTSPTQFEQRLSELGWEIDPADVEAAFSYAFERVQVATKLGLATREARFAIKADAAGGKLLAADGVAGEEATTFTSSGRADLGRSYARAVSWPELSLYHGSVVGIGWPGRGFGVAPSGLLGGEVGGPPAAEDVNVYLGGTIPEALATCLSHNGGQADEARFLEAVLLGATQELEEPDAAARIDSRLHASAFAAFPGGSRSERVVQHAPSTPSSVVPDPSRTDPGVFGRQPARGAALAGAARAATSGRMVGMVNVPAAERIVPKLAEGTRDSVLAELKRRALEQVEVDVAPIAAAANAEPAAETVEARRPQPRFFVPADPVFLLEGGGRSFKHGERPNAESAKLACRLSGHTVTELAPARAAKLPGGGAVSGDDLLERSLDHGGIPMECADLLRELVLLDPGSASIAVRATARGGARLPAAEHEDLAKVFAVEQVAWWVTRDERRDSAHLLAASGFTGTLPAPVAVGLPTRPWTPLHLDWEVELLPAPDFAGWELEEIDFDARAETLPEPGAPGTRTLAGRALLGAGAAQVAAATVRKVLEQSQQAGGSQELRPRVRYGANSHAAVSMMGKINRLRVRDGDGGGSEQPDLDHIADELERMDVLVGAMDRFNSKLRAGYVADGADAPEDGVPEDFWPLRSGFMRIRRLRLVDCFGQVLDLVSPEGEAGADPASVTQSETLAVEDRPDLVELAPRFTAPTRLLLRFLDASDDGVEADESSSPVCGFVLPNHLDGDLQVHAADGEGLGAVRFDAAAGVIWEDAPGRPTAVGGSPPAAVANRRLAGIAQGLLDWGAVDATPDAPAVDTALSSLLRIVDATLWSVDPFAHIGDEHLALLVGHPIAVLRAMVRVEVAEPVDPATVRGLRVPVRVGALAHWQDGLLGYFVDDDYRTLCVPDPACADFARPLGPNQGFNQQASATAGYYSNFAADLGVTAQPGATPVDHPYVDTGGLLWVQPGQQVMLTLLVEPHGVVHATSGYLPRKEIGMRREWVAPGLARLAPTFRFGPVLVDPKLIRMPVAADIRGTWSWSHRATATTWADEPVTNSTGDARVPPDPSEGQEGWLKLNPQTPETGS